MSQAELYQRQARRAWLLGGAVAFVLLALIVWLVVASLSRHDTPSPQIQVSTPQATPEETAPDSRVSDLATRVIAFETVYHSFDWSDPTQREKSLAQYMTEEAFGKLMQAEHSLPMRQTLIDEKNTRTATVVAEPVGDFIDVDLADASTEVEVASTTSSPGAVPETYTITSETEWVLSQGIWLVSSVDLIAQEEA